MTVNWFYGEASAKLGPFSASQLKDLQVLGKLQPSDMVWKENVKNGLRAGEIRGLFGSEQPGATALEVAILPVLNEAFEESVAAHVPPTVPESDREQVPKIVPESIELVPIPEDKPVASQAPDAIHALPSLQVPMKTELKPSPDKPSGTGGDQQAQEVPCPVRPKPKPAPAPHRKLRAVVESGAIIVSQDGERVRFRKKCVKCAFEESSNTMMRLMPGVNRQTFFCPKCRKQMGITIRAV